MLGEQLGQEQGKITGRRVLPSDGRGPKVEITFQARGTILGTEATDLGTYWSVVLPVSAPAFVVTAIWQFTSIWNDFLFAVFIVTDPSQWPVTVALNNTTGSIVTPYNVQMAAALIASIPTLIVYILLGRYFMRGLMAGALKG